MNKFSLIAATLAGTVAVAAPAAAKDKMTFTHDGVTYIYTETKAGDSTVIQGRAVNGPDFYYVVRNGQVVGKTDNTPVSFRVEDAVASADSDDANG